MYFNENTKRTEPVSVPLANGTPTVIAQFTLNNDDLLIIGLGLAGANALSNFDIQANVFPGEPFVSLRPDATWSTATERVPEISSSTVNTNPSALTSADTMRLTVDVSGLAEIKILATASGAGDTLRLSMSKPDSRFRKSWVYRGQ